MIRLVAFFILLYTAVLTVGSLHASEEQDDKKDLGGIRGEIKIGIEGVAITDIGPIVVYLATNDSRIVSQSNTNQIVTIGQVSQELANFVPRFIVVTVGQPVEFPNNDKIVHNVFSYSEPNQFDLGLYPSGTSKSIIFRHPGLVRIYCSIHKSMSGLVFVTPTPFHVMADKLGSFAIYGIPAGVYQLKTWNEMVPEIVQQIEIVSGKTEDVIVLIDEKAK